MPLGAIHCQPSSLRCIVVCYLSNIRINKKKNQKRITKKTKDREENREEGRLGGKIEVANVVTKLDTVVFWIVTTEPASTTSYDQLNNRESISYLTSPHLTSPHLTSPNLTSPDTSFRIPMPPPLSAEFSTIVHPYMLPCDARHEIAPALTEALFLEKLEFVSCRTTEFSTEIPAPSFPEFFVKMLLAISTCEFLV